MYRWYFKRAFDFSASLILLILLSPIIFVAFLILTIVNNGEAFFLQERPGYKAKPFHIIKFKTMRDTRNSNGELLPDYLRLTKAGQVIRKLSIDELPQLINVLKGEMSLIGPRPLLMAYLNQYNDFQRRRHDVKPGITGWAQVNGRNTISWDQKFKCDVWYVDNQSFSLDVKILYLTAIKVLKRSDVNFQENIPMPRFQGNKVS